MFISFVNKAHSKKMTFSEEDKIVIKFLRQNKNYGAKKFLTKFPDKGWTLGGLKALLRKIDLTGSSKRRMGSVDGELHGKLKISNKFKISF